MNMELIQTNMLIIIAIVEFIRLCFILRSYIRSKKHEKCNK